MVNYTEAKSIESSLNPKNIDNLCDEIAEIRHYLIASAMGKEDITPLLNAELIEALECLDMYMEDEARSIMYYYRSLIANNPKCRELVEEYYKETLEEDYIPDFKVIEEIEGYKVIARE
jgi:hypothetical protein